jgi:hypothetical protein
VRKELYVTMAKLGALLKGLESGGDLWSDKLPAAGEAAGLPANSWRKIDNPTLPSGYTYFLQFVAHDVVDTVLTMQVEADGSVIPFLRDNRLRPLMLDTLYGSGPDEAPYAYVGERAGNLTRHVDAPRTRLRIGDFPMGAPTGCPARDFLRQRPDARPDPQNPTRTDALVADPRNDFHPIVAQMTLLFAMLHNWVIDRIESKEPRPPIELLWRQFLCARTIVTLIYRAVVEHDLMPRLLHPAVVQAYSGPSGLALDDGHGVPLEFAAGAFRFGHALVQQDYFLNSASATTAIDFTQGLSQSSRNGVAPDTVWAIDWRHFFRPGVGKPGAAQFNLSRRIGPFFSAPLNGPPFDSLLQFEGLETIDFDTGLAIRDCLAASYTALWSVPALAEVVRGKLRSKNSPLADLIPPAGTWEQPIATWLRSVNTPAGTPRHLSATDIERLAKDPPLSFFVLFEAAHQIDAQGRPQLPSPGDGIPGHGGATLGLLGSIIVAETMYGALRQGPRASLAESDWLEREIKGHCTVLGVDPAPLEPLWTKAGAPRHMSTMWSIVSFLEELGFPKCI